MSGESDADVARALAALGGGELNYRSFGPLPLLAASAALRENPAPRPDAALPAP